MTEKHVSSELPLADPEVLPLPAETTSPRVVAQSLSDVIARAYPQVRASAARLVRDRADAEDLVQAAMMRFWRRHLAGLPAKSARHFVAEMELFMRDALRMEQRRYARRASKHLRLMSTVTTFVATHVSSPFISGLRNWMAPDRDVLVSEVDPLVERAIASLPQRPREVFELLTRHGLTYEEVSARLGVGIITVRAHMSKASTLLRARLERQGFVRRPAGASAAKPATAAGNGRTAERTTVSRKEPTP